MRCRSISGGGALSDTTLRDPRRGGSVHTTQTWTTDHLALWRELPWLVVVGLLILGLCALPAVVAARVGDPTLERVGTLWFIRDFSQYQAAMREGARSASWLIHNHFTAEPHAPALMYPLYVALGKIAALADLDPLQVFGATEWLARVVLLGALYGFAATFLTTAKERRLALLLMVGTLGFAGWLVPLRLATGLPASGPASGEPDQVINVFLELNTFGVFLSAPHLILGLALTLLAAPVYLRAARSGSPRWIAAVGLVVGVLSLVHPFNLPVLVSVLALDALLRTRGVLRTVRPWRVPAPLLAAGVAGLAAAPVALYNLLLFQWDPFWSGTYGAQNRMPAPPPWALPVDFGLVLVAAPLAWWAMQRWPAERRRLLLIWVALGLLWWYVPVPYQRRFAFGVQPALAVLAAVGLLAVNQWMRTRSWGAIRRRLANYSVALAAGMTPVLLYLTLVVSAARNEPLEVYLWTRAEARAGAWLAAHSTADDVVLAATLFANPLVGVIDGRVVHGHIVATRESDRKEALVERFYHSSTPPAERSAILRESGATIVGVGPRERALGATSLDAQPELTRIYDQDGVTWYRVARSSP